MITRSAAAVAFAMPGGEGFRHRAAGRVRSISRICRRQTLGDRALEQEVLRLFVQQALSVRDQIAEARQARTAADWRTALKGSARGVGAFAIADVSPRSRSSPTTIS